MQKLAEICIARPVFATMLILAMVVAGVVGFWHLPVDRYPAVDLPTVTIRTELPGASPEEVEVAVSYPIEEAVNTVEGITELRSVNGAGTSLVLATFDLGRDIDAAAQDVRDRVAQAARQLPRDAEAPVVGKFDNDSTPVLTLALAGPRSMRELSEIADKRIKRVLERSRGVGEVKLVGSLRRTINVWLDADRLAAYDLPVSRVRSALARQNADVPGGNVTTDAVEQTLRTMGRLVDPAAFPELVVETRGNVPIRVADLGTAEDGTEEPRSLARLNGQATVVLEVRRQSGANTIAVIDGIQRGLERLRQSLPPDLELQVIRDQSRYIRAALHEIEFHLVVGSILASIVVLLFLRSLRATIVAAVAIPASVVTTFAVMWALGFTLNSITMLALVLMVGVVIDDAIVVLENVHRWAAHKGVEPFQAAREATREIGLAVLATTLSLVVIFVPVAFMSSISGRFLFQFGITSAVAVLVSLVVSFSLTPMMSARMLRQGMRLEHATVPPRSERIYAALLRWCLRRPWLTLLLLLPIMASSVPLYGLVRQDYIPSDVDEGEFEINVNGPEGASLPAIDQALHAIEAQLAQIPAIETVLTTVGGGFLSGVNNGTIWVRIAPHEQRRFSLGRLWAATLRGEPLAAWRGNYTQREVMSDIRRRLRQFPDLRCSVRNQRSFNIGGGNFDIDFSIRGPDLVALAGYGDALKQRANELGGFVDLDTTLRLNRPELRVEIDRARAAELGVDTEDIAAALRVMVGGDLEVSRFRDRTLDEEYDVRLRLRPQDRTDPRRIEQLLVPRTSGPPVRLDNLVRLAPAQSASRIDRMDRQRQTSLRGAPAPGFALGDRIAALRQAAAELGMPAEYSTAVAGRARELERTFDEFLVAFLLSLLFMYMILAAQFESLTQPAIILLSLPLAAPFAMLSLVLADETLNLYSALGVLVLFGMVKKNAILQIDHANQLFAKGMSADAAVLRGSCDRLRPILMTTLAFVAGMLPLAIGAGPGAEERKAISVVVIGGQMLSLVLTLLLTPVLHKLLLARSRR
ncbi:MAG: efflux RND transporter permease subunit [Planctomycetes bacterium]|nr:efflux RND transporter permease subunit [Planctomycetota bacterium]